MEIVDEGGDHRVPGVRDENFGGRDDGLDVLQIDHDSPFPPQNRRRVGEQGIQDPQIPRWKPRPPHDRVLAHLLETRPPGVRDDQPRPARRALPPPGSRVLWRRRRHGCRRPVAGVVVQSLLWGPHLRREGEGLSVCEAVLLPSRCSRTFRSPSEIESESKKPKKREAVWRVIAVSVRGIFEKKNSGSRYRFEFYFGLLPRSWPRPAGISKGAQISKRLLRDPTVDSREVT